MEGGGKNRDNVNRLIAVWHPMCLVKDEHLPFSNWPWASLIAQLVKNPPAMQETPVQFLGREDPLEKE